MVVELVVTRVVRGSSGYSGGLWDDGMLRAEGRSVRCEPRRDDARDGKMSILRNLLDGKNPDGSNRIPSKSRETIFSEARACVVRDWPNQDDVARLYRALDEIERRGSFEPSVAALLRTAEYLAFPS